MTYDPNVPGAAQSLGETQSKIQQNFSDIDTHFKVNHVEFNKTDAGKHNFCQMPEQSSAPATAVNEGAIYTKVGVSPAETNVFFKGENEGKEYQLTTSVEAQTAKFGTDTNYQVGPPSLNGGWTFLPGGMILQWGLTNAAASSTTFAITFPFVFPQNVWNIQVTGTRASSSPGNTDGWVSTAGLSTTGFTIFNNGGHSFKFYWMAIGN